MGKGPSPLLSLSQPPTNFTPFPPDLAPAPRGPENPSPTCTISSFAQNVSGDSQSGYPGVGSYPTSDTTVKATPLRVWVSWSLPFPDPRGGGTSPAGLATRAETGRADPGGPRPPRGGSVGLPSPPVFISPPDAILRSHQVGNWVDRTIPRWSQPVEFFRLCQPVEFGGWVNRLSFAVESTGWVARLNQPVESTGWVAWLNQPVGFFSRVNRLGCAVESVWGEGLSPLNTKESKRGGESRRGEGVTRVPFVRGLTYWNLICLHFAYIF